MDADKGKNGEMRVKLSVFAVNNCLPRKPNKLNGKGLVYMREFREDNINMWKSLAFICANTNKLEQIMEIPLD